jgi:hypothetical protein
MSTMNDQGVVCHSIVCSLIQVEGRRMSTYTAGEEPFLQELRATNQHHRVYLKLDTGGRDQVEFAADGHIQ